MRCPRGSCQRISPSDLTSLKVGNVEYSKLIEEIKGFNAGIQKRAEERRPAMGDHLKAGVENGEKEHGKEGTSQQELSDPMNELLGLSVNDIIAPAASQKEENLMDLGFDMPLVFDRHNQSNDPADLNLIGFAAPVTAPTPTSAQPKKPANPEELFDFDMTIKKDNSKQPEQPTQAPVQPKIDDPFGFL